MWSEGQIAVNMPPHNSFAADVWSRQAMHTLPHQRVIGRSEIMVPDNIRAETGQVVLPRLAQKNTSSALIGYTYGKECASD